MDSWKEEDSELRNYHFLGSKCYYIVGGWTNPSEKYARQIGSFSQVGVKNLWNHHLGLVFGGVAPKTKTKQQATQHAFRGFQATTSRVGRHGGIPGSGTRNQKRMMLGGTGSFKISCITFSYIYVCIYINIYIYIYIPPPHKKKNEKSMVGRCITSYWSSVLTLQPGFCSNFQL